MSDRESQLWDNTLRRKTFWENYKKNKNINLDNSIYIMDFPVEKQLDCWNNYNEHDEIKLAGRITKKRTIGALSFLKIMDFSTEIQIMLKKEIFNEYDDIIHNLFYGDLIAVKGIIGFSNTGEKTIIVNEITMISCNYRSVPDKWHGINDPDFRYRNSYILHYYDNDFKNIIVNRWKLMASIRKFFDNNHFLEVETPILQHIASGAAARPFKTHHNALDMDLYLRIAPELSLKTMITAGYTRIFEMGKNFRNEGVDPTHLQEFTMLECYIAYEDCDYYINFTKELFKFIVKELKLSTLITFRGHEINLEQEWPVISFADIIKEKTSIDINDINLKESIKNYLIKNNENYNILETLNSSMGLVDFIYKKACRPSIIQPTFIVEYPQYMAPLASVKGNKSTKMQLVIAGIELTNCYGELVDPLIQENNFKTQEESQKIINKSSKDDEAEDLFRRDNDFLNVMEFGMPPMAGFGMGIDRLLSFLMGEDNLKNTLLIPLIHNKNND